MYVCPSGVEWFPLVGSGALRAVEYGAFAVQFLRWWDTRAAPTAALPTPPPPPVTIYYTYTFANEHLTAILPMFARYK